MFSIQLGLAESMGLRLEHKTLLARANKLRETLLMKAPKRTLVILDDVWQTLSLEDLGLPNGSAWTVIVTSRDRSIFGAMNVVKVCTLSTLSEAEELPFFMEKAGNCVDDQTLVEDVGRECNGLPIALAVVARALRHNTEKDEWRGALRQLRTSNPADLPTIHAEVYNPIKLSYDFLQNEHARVIFLLCSLFPEDYNIPFEDLVSYCVGLGIFEDIDNLGEARAKTSTLVSMLKSRFLLLDGSSKKMVRMHDNVRDVAIFIASKEGRIDRNIGSVNWLRENSTSNCTWISSCLDNRVELPTRLNFPKIRLLLAGAVGETEFGMEERLFEGMSGLNVVSIRSTSSSSLPQSIQILKNLRTLVFYDCKSLETISVVGELTNLEILSCQFCPSIKELSIEIGRLSCLKQLEVSSCRNLNRIESGVISGLVKLEELEIMSSFDGWEREDREDTGKERKNASLDELQSLPNLTTLRIDVKDTSLVGQDLNLSRNIVRYNIRIEEVDDDFELFEERGGERNMLLELSRDSSLGNWVHKFLMNAEGLCLQGEYSNNVDLLKLENLKWLEFRECSRVKTLVPITQPIGWRSGVFPCLEGLMLDELPNLEQICDGAIPEGSNSFGKLKELGLATLPRLKNLWGENQNVSLGNISSISVVNCGSLQNLSSLKMDSLLNLSSLEITSCNGMKEVLRNDGASHIAFPRLDTLILGQMQKLSAFCTGVERIELSLTLLLKLASIDTH